MAPAKSIYDELCEKLGGKPDYENNVCWMGDWPAPLDEDEWWHCAPYSYEGTLREKGFNVLIDPKKAKKIFPERKYYDEDVVSALRKRIREGKPICPPWREICFIENGYEFCTTGHEGRHRIKAAIEEGLDLIPVLFPVNKYPCN